MNVELIKNNIPLYDSEKLCDIIVCERYFDMNQNDIVISCMEELSKRRSDGSEFNFEKYISKNFNELPKLDLKTTDIRDMLKNIIGSIK